MDLTPLMDVVRTLRSPGAVLGIRPRIIRVCAGNLWKKSMSSLKPSMMANVKGIREELGDVLFRWSSMPVWQKKWGLYDAGRHYGCVPETHPPSSPCFMVRSRSEARRSFSRIGMPSKQKRKKERKSALDGNCPRPAEPDAGL